MANQYLSLSLFLMLLSFFIIMNGNSGFDDTKARPVMQSLSLAFSNTTTEQGQAPLDEIVPETHHGEGETLERIESLFSAHIPGVQAKRNRLGNMMRIRMPVRSFETGIDFSGLSSENENKQGSEGERGKFLPMLVALLQSQSSGVPYRMDMLLDVPDDPVSLIERSPAFLSEKTALVSSFANSLQSAGIPGPLLGTGLQKGENGFIDIFFRRDEPYEPAPGQEKGEPL
ncbi:MAG: hypothetical protein KDI90_01400 [Alphaproteobacteria bacterium]|nr:hypothetical protein [Alphaproteobacteria bacterium]MCB9974085.1 hypothetical protein [Rhodospirillales bacterium]